MLQDPYGARIRAGMVEIALSELVDSGPAMLGASADVGLVPECFRVWGAVYDAGSERLRLMVNADASRTVDGVREGSRIAVTFTDILTFRSLQVKGAAVGPPSIPGPSDIAVMRQYTERFTVNLTQIGHPATLGDRLRPAALFVLEMSVEDRFDQTPGRGAGAVIGGR